MIAVLHNEIDENEVAKMNNEYTLEMRHITKVFPGVKALDNVSLNVRPGTQKGVAHKSQ